jgi:hypothetical protein
MKIKTTSRPQPRKKIPVTKRKKTDKRKSSDQGDGDWDYVDHAGSTAPEDSCQEDKDSQYTDMTVQKLARKFKNKEYRKPHFQREYEWNSNKEFEFIMFLKNHKVLPTNIVVDKNGDIIDGLHRVTCLSRFVNGALDEVFAKKGAQLSVQEKAQILAITVRVVALDLKDDKERVSFFEKINTTSKAVRVIFCIFSKALSDKNDRMYELACAVERAYKAGRVSAQKKADLFKMLCILCASDMVRKDKSQIIKFGTEKLLYTMDPQFYNFNPSFFDDFIEIVYKICNSGPRYKNLLGNSRVLKAVVLAELYLSGAISTTSTPTNLLKQFSTNTQKLKKFMGAESVARIHKMFEGV